MKEVLYIWNLPSYWSSVALAHVLWCVCVCVFSYRCCLCVPDNTLIINRLWDAVHSSEVRLMLTATITASPVMWRMTHRCTQSTYKPRLRCVCVCVCVCFVLEDLWKSACFPAQRLFILPLRIICRFGHALLDVSKRPQKLCSHDLMRKYALYLSDLWLGHDLKNALTYKSVFIN